MGSVAVLPEAQYIVPERGAVAGGEPLARPGARVHLPQNPVPTATEDHSLVPRAHSVQRLQAALRICRRVLRRQAVVMGNRVVGHRGHDRTMKLLVLGSVLIAAGVQFGTPASADPTPPPSPGYIIQGPGESTVGGLRTLPPICATQPRACAGDWSPDTGTWVFAPGT
jgi:hypothetical protein